MSTHLPRLRRALLASGLASLMIASAAQASANKVGADVRVISDNGKILVDQRQYTGTTKIKTSRKADCFGTGTGGSGDAVKVPGATALGVVNDASAYQRKLRPLSITDAFDFGLGICGFGNAIAPQTGYWYLKQNHVGSLTGGDQTQLGNKDDVLWYLISDYNEPTPAELELKAPVSVKRGEKIKAKVFEYADDGTRTPAEGAKVGDATTSASGVAMVSAAGANTRLVARRDGAIPSRALEVCQIQKLGGCPKGHTLKITGTDGKDKIKSDKRPVVIDGLRRQGQDRRPQVAELGTAARSLRHGQGRRDRPPWSEADRSQELREDQAELTDEPGPQHHGRDGDSVHRRGRGLWGGSGRDPGRHRDPPRDPRPRRRADRRGHGDRSGRVGDRRPLPRSGERYRDELRRQLRRLDRRRQQ